MIGVKVRVGVGSGFTLNRYSPVLCLSDWTGMKLLISDWTRTMKLLISDWRRMKLLISDWVSLT